MSSKKSISSIVIHQPHFFAWIPYYCRIATAENFVILDNVNYRRYFYQDRSYILDPKKRLIQISLPNNGSPDLKIKDIVLITPSYYIEKIYKSIYLNYKRQKYFDEIFHFLLQSKEDFESENSLVILNYKIVRFVLNILEIPLPEIYFSSNISFTIDRNQRLIDICKFTSKKNILCGWGASSKIHDISALNFHNIRLIAISREEFIAYSGLKEMIDGVSILDVLMRYGINSTKSIFSKCSELYQNRCND